MPTDSSGEGAAALVDPGRLGAWLADHVEGAGRTVSVAQLAGGASNLTFRVRDGVHDWVLRRPPASHVLATAHDMVREFRVQRALAHSAVPVASQVALCEDETVIGAPFYLMAHVDGVVYADVDAVAGITEEEAQAASVELVDVLARLHSADPRAVGLQDFGRPEGFMARQLRRWRAQWEQSKLEEDPTVEEVARRLDAALPPEGGHAIVHGDYSFNNTMFDRAQRGRMVALLDWELSTLGDPLTDLGTLLVYWGEVGRRLWQGRRPQAHRAGPGFLDAPSLAAQYAQRTGTDLEHLDFYQAFATYKLAVITQGAAARIAGSDPERAASARGSVRVLADAALELCG